MKEALRQGKWRMLQAKRCDIVTDRLTGIVERGRKSGMDDGWIEWEEIHHLNSKWSWLYIPVSTEREILCIPSDVTGIATGEPAWTGNPLGDLSARGTGNRLHISCQEFTANYR